MRVSALIVAVFVFVLGVVVWAATAHSVVESGAAGRSMAQAKRAPPGTTVVDDNAADDRDDASDDRDDRDDADGSDAASARLVGVWSSGAESFAVGDGGAVLHSADGGKSFFAQRGGVDADLRAVWGASPADVFAVGDDGTILHQQAAGVWRHSESGVESALNAVSGRGARDVFVVGDEGVVLHSVDRGQSWERIDCGTDSDLTAVSASPSGPVLIVGDDGTIRTIDAHARCSGPAA